MGLLSRMRRLFKREELAKEHDEELEFHLAMREQLNIEQGMPVTEAHRDARLRFGNVTLWQERLREIDLALLPQTIWQDLRYGARTLWRNAWFTMVSVFAMALGIGVNTATFTAYKAFFKRPLDAHDSGQMVNIALKQRSSSSLPDFSYSDYETYRDHIRSFNGLIAWEGIERLTLTGDGGVKTRRGSAEGTLVGRLGLLPSGVGNAEFATSFFVSENYFSVLGVGAVRGRTFEAADFREQASTPSALISENYWQKRFGGDANVLGRTIRLNGAVFTIVGITPRNFVGTSVAVPAFWLPLSAEPLVHPDHNWLRDREYGCCRLFARLAPGVPMGQAESEMSALSEHLRTLHDRNSDRGKTIGVALWPGSPFPFPLQEYGGLKYSVLLIMAAVGMVLVIACANVAGLQLARAASRQSELSMRISLGATRRRIVRQLLTESALLGLIAGATALLFSWAMLQVLVKLAADALPADYGTFIFHVTPDPGIFAYVFVLSLFAGILFGLAPALEGSNSALSSGLKGNAGTAPVRSRRMRDFLMASQVAISLVLLIAGSMLIRSSIRALRMDTGYDTKHTISLELQFPEWQQYPDARRATVVDALRKRLAAVPGVQAITHGRPPDGGGMRTAAVSLNGEKPSPQNTRALLFYTFVRGDYFQTLKIPMLFGRTFATQAGPAEPSVVLSESAAQILWPGQNPIGRHIRLGTDGQFHGKNELLPDGPTYEVVGVGRNTRGILLDGTDSEQIYVPLPDDRLKDYPILIRTHSNPDQSMGAIAQAISTVDPNVAATSLTLDELLRQTPAFLASGLAAAFASTIGFLGLLLASMGIYSMASYIVVLRTREVGIRVALGATKRDILGLMLRQGLRPVLAGLLVGTILASGASYLLRGVLYGLRGVDGISFAGVSLLFLAIALTASYLPSRRAMRVDPMVALRYE
jgi:predicted permease